MSPPTGPASLRLSPPPLAGFARLWRAVADGYLRLMDSRWGYNLFGRAIPSAFFLLAAVAGAERFEDLLPRLSEGSRSNVLLLLQDLLGYSIGLSMVVLFAVRKRRIGPASTVLGAVVALLASYYGMLLVFFDSFGLRRPPPAADPDPLVASVSFGVAYMATCLLAVSWACLGRHVGVFPEVRGLVTRGPYRFLRHPIYVAYLLFAFGGLLRAFSPEAVLIFLGYYGLVCWRVALEERAFLEVFGDEYRRYQATTWGVAPAWAGRLLRRIRQGGIGTARPV